MYRTDIAALFPTSNNANGAGGIFDLNTTNYSDGVHTIKWSVTDDNDNTNGDIGSREFVEPGTYYIEVSAYDFNDSSPFTLTVNSP